MYKRVWLVMYLTGIRYFYGTEEALQRYLSHDVHYICYKGADKEDLKYQDMYNICSENLQEV